MKGLNFLSKMANKRIRVWTSGRSLPCIKLISDVIGTVIFSIESQMTLVMYYITCSLPDVLGFLEKGDMTLFFPK